MPLSIYLGPRCSKCAEMEVLWWPDFLKFISDFLTSQIFFWSSRLFAPWLKTMIFQRFRMKFTKEINSWNSRSNFQNVLNIFSDNIFLWNLFSLKGIPLYFRFRTSRAPEHLPYILTYTYKLATPPSEQSLNNQIHMSLFFCPLAKVDKHLIFNFALTFVIFKVTSWAFQRFLVWFWNVHFRGLLCFGASKTKLPMPLLWGK